MKAIWLIVKREYLIRIGRKSFLIMTFVTPLIFVIILMAPGLFSKLFETERTVEVLNETGNIQVQAVPHIHFVYVKGSVEAVLKQFKQGTNNALLYIPVENRPTVQLYTRTNADQELKELLAPSVQKMIEETRLLQAGITLEKLQQIKAGSVIDLITLSDSGNGKVNPVILSSIAIFFSILIHIFIFTYGSQVMRGVIEEKTNRIVEVLIATIKPFQLMIGKIIGIVGVGLTQFIVWVLLFGCFFLLLPYLQSSVGEHFIGKSREIQIFLNALQAIDFTFLILSFIIYFIAGYLLYAALFAAIGASVEKEADTQQFVMPVTSPLILALLMVQYIIKDPDSSLATGLSLFPFTSPIIMLLRLPFGGVTPLQWISSVTLLIVSFLIITWLAAKIYRVGILATGKKAGLKELAKWFTMKV